MVRGCQKRIYYVKNTGSPIFEEAYFVLRKSPSEMEPSGDLTGEANRIVQEITSATSWYKHNASGHNGSTGQKLCAFIVGAASSSAIIGGVALLLAFS